MWVEHWAAERAGLTAVKMASRLADWTAASKECGSAGPTASRTAVAWAATTVVETAARWAVWWAVAKAEMWVGEWAALSGWSAHWWAGTLASNWVAGRAETLAQSQVGLRVDWSVVLECSLADNLVVVWAAEKERRWAVQWAAMMGCLKAEKMVAPMVVCWADCLDD